MRVRTVARLCLLETLFFAVRARAYPTETPAPTRTAEAGDSLVARQQQPFNINTAVAQAVDPSYYSIQDGTTVFVGSNPAALSTVVATSGSSTSTIAAQAGLNSAEVDGETEYSLFLAPELLLELRQMVVDAYNDTNNNQRRDLSTVDKNALANQMAVPLGVATAAGLANSLVSSTVAKVGFGGFLSSVITIGGQLFPLISILTVAINNWIGIWTEFSDPNFMKAVKVPVNLPTTSQCPSSPPSCSSCGGTNSLCSTTPAECPCYDGCPADDNDMLPCDECGGVGTSVCTEGDQNGCPCAQRYASISDPFDADVWNVAAQISLKVAQSLRAANTKGTNVHVNRGCVTFNGDTPRCAPDFYNVADQFKANDTVAIFAQFDGSDTTSQTVVPGCFLLLQIPYNYGDVYFGADNCVYDSQSKPLGQCCQAKYYLPVANAYFKSTPSPSSTPVAACATSTSYTCQENCCGYIPCPDWCNANCGGFYKGCS